MKKLLIKVVRKIVEWAKLSDEQVVRIINRREVFMEKGMNRFEAAKKALTYEDK